MKRVATALLVILACLVVAPGTATAKPDAGTVREACANNQPKTTVLWVTDEQNVTRATTLYPGTQVYISYCGGKGPVSTTTGETRTWNVTGVTGLDIHSETNTLYGGKVSAAASSIVLDDMAIGGKVPENTVRIVVRQGPAVASNLTGGPLLFRNSTATEYQDRERRYLLHTGELRSEARRLNETAKTVQQADGVPLTDLTEANRTLANISETHRAATESADDLRLLLYDNVTDAEPTPESYTRSMEAVEERQRSTNQTVMNSIHQYNEALESVAKQARQTILLNLLFGLVPGFALGGLSGAAVIKKRGESSQYFRDYGSGDDSTQELYLLVGAGLGLIGIGALSLVVTGVLGAIV